MLAVVNLIALSGDSTPTRLNLLSDIADYLLGSSVRREEPSDAELCQHLYVLLRDDTSSRKEDVGRVLLPQNVKHFGKGGHVKSGVAGNANNVHVLLNRGVRNHFRSLPQPAVDDLHAGIPEDESHEFRRHIVAVKARRSDIYAYPFSHPSFLYLGRLVIGAELFLQHGHHLPQSGVDLHRVDNRRHGILSTSRYPAQIIERPSDGFVAPLGPEFG